MKQKTALMVILILSGAGILFSGYLSYSELVRGSCALGTCTNVGSVPACVYGLVMYLAVFVISLLGLKSGRGK